MAWQIRADGYDYCRRDIQRPTEGRNLLLSNAHSILENDGATVIALYQEKVERAEGELVGKSEGFASIAKAKIEEILGRNVIEFGNNSVFTIKESADELTCFIQKKGKSLELFVEGEEIVKVNDKQIESGKKLKANDTIQIGSISERVGTFDELVLKAVNAYLFSYNQEKGKNSELCMALARIQDGKIALTYTPSGLIGVHGYNAELLNQERMTSPENMGVNAQINPINKIFKLRNNPCLFMCSTSYYDMIKQQDAIFEILSTQYSEVKTQNKTLDDAMKSLMGSGGFPKPAETQQIGMGGEPLHPEFSFVTFMSYSGIVNVGELLKNKYAVGSAALIIALAAFLGLRSNKEPGKPKAVDIEKPEPKPSQAAKEVIKKPEPPEEKAEPAIKIVAEEVKEEPADKPFLGFEEKPFLEISPDAHVKNYKEIHSQLEMAMETLAGINYRNADNRRDKLDGVQKTIESSQTRIKEGKVANADELEKELSGLRNRYEPMRDYVGLLNQIKDDATKDKAHASLADLLFREGEYDLAWLHVEQVPKAQRPGLGLIHRIYLLEKAAADPEHKVKRTEKGLTEEVITYTETSIAEATKEQGLKYKRIGEIIGGLDAYFVVEPGNALILVNELPEFEEQLSKLPSDSLNAKELAWMISAKKQMLSHDCTKVVEQARMVLKKDGKITFDRSMYKQLGDLYAQAKKPDMAKHYYEKVNN